jgi:hypothetical protein
MEVWKRRRWLRNERVDEGEEERRQVLRNRCINCGVYRLIWSNSYNYSTTLPAAFVRRVSGSAAVGETIRSSASARREFCRPPMYLVHAFFPSHHLILAIMKGKIAIEGANVTPQVDAANRPALAQRLSRFLSSLTSLEPAHLLVSLLTHVHSSRSHKPKPTQTRSRRRSATASPRGCWTSTKGVSDSWTHMEWSTWFSALRLPARKVLRTRRS